MRIMIENEKQLKYTVFGKRVKMVCIIFSKRLGPSFVGRASIAVLATTDLAVRLLVSSHHTWEENKTALSL